ncbi:flagellar hook-length control protein FliK [Piscinibacter gummiphilus]|uniref:Flagellar hook-length control protein FliK n=1 Tax=Piscinibacter gummiphilus TaxID=946333 RepID=A0ABZ0D2U1_9BURK|nr:flagellar hook-length control protein FliK [Piscinibacter gummiphilus]WOB09821.1 flagellar hook-length control protein FliK [Piscinibacter gummiphilus]
MNPAISSFVPPVAPQMPAQPAAPAPSSQPGFSQMLSQAQAREAEAPTPDAAPEAAAPKPAHASERGHKSEKAEKAGKADKGQKAESETRTDKAAKAEGEADAVECADKPEAEAPAADPALADWLASLQRPVVPPEAEAGKGRAAAASDELADTAEASKKGGARGALAAAGKDVKAQDAAQEARELKAKPEPTTRDAAESPSFKAALAQADDSRRDVKPAQELQTPHAVGVATTHAASRTGETTAPVAVQVPTQATAPEFARELGVQVSVLAKDGIQQAELHLNPAEMGPISVQIAIDGTQAQVNFGADSAATRQIIENGLPELAASLREAGFTLSGGGVHSQARGREQGEGDGRGERGDGNSRALGGVETDVTSRRVVSRVSEGGVDVYA